MLQGKCAECSSTDALSSFKAVGDKLYCARCVANLAQQAGQQGQRLEPLGVIDPTVCIQCKADNGSTEWPRAGSLPYCPRCREALYERPFPVWLRAGLAALLVLLAFALAHGARYFRAGIDLAKGERLINSREYPRAIPHLRATVAAAPACEKCILLLAKADLLSGDPWNAQKELTGHNGGRFKGSPLSQEVDGILTRAGKAAQKAVEAEKAEQQMRWDDAVSAMHEATRLYPEAPRLLILARWFEAAAAFEHKDYDRFVSVAEQVVKAQQDSPDNAAMLASALACKYAVTGDATFRARAEQMLGQAHRLAQSDPEALKRYDEYSERIAYRLRSREIIDTDEYNHRFRQKQSRH
jgi:tetratricopeptide (TPR) repeat protein